MSLYFRHQRVCKKDTSILRLYTIGFMVVFVCLSLTGCCPGCCLLMRIGQEKMRHGRIPPYLEAFPLPTFIPIFHL
jgi:hypothetical protein